MTYIFVPVVAGTAQAEAAMSFFPTKYQSVIMWRQYFTGSSVQCSKTGTVLINWATQRAYMPTVFYVSPQKKPGVYNIFLSIRTEDGCFLYGVFNGYDGSRVASFASQCLTAELLLEPLKSSHTDSDVRRILTQVERLHLVELESCYCFMLLLYSTVQFQRIHRIYWYVCMYVSNRISS